MTTVPLYQVYYVYNKTGLPSQLHTNALPTSHSHNMVTFAQANTKKKKLTGVANLQITIVAKRKNGCEK